MINIHHEETNETCETWIIFQHPRHFGKLRYFVRGTDRTCYYHADTASLFFVSRLFPVGCGSRWWRRTVINEDSPLSRSACNPLHPFSFRAFCLFTLQIPSAGADTRSGVHARNYLRTLILRLQNHSWCSYIYICRSIGYFFCVSDDGNASAVLNYNSIALFVCTRL